MPNLLKEVISKIPGTKRRTVIEARFVDGDETLATLRAGTPESLNELLGKTMANFSIEPILNGKVVFEADTIASVPVLGDVRLDTQQLGTSADGAYRRAINLLTPKQPTDIQPTPETL